MDKLLYFRQGIKAFFQRNDIYLIPLLKFLLMMGILLMMNWHLGYRYMLMRWILVILASLISCLLPWGGMTAVAGLYLLGHVSALSWEGAAVLAVLMFAAVVLHFFFLPGGSFLIVLIPMAFYLKVPYIVPLLAGAMGSALTFIPVGIGVVMYYMLIALESSAALLLDPGSSVLVCFQTLVSALRSNREMMVLSLIFMLVTLAVFAFSRLSLDYADLIAVIGGGLMMLLGMLVLGSVLGASIVTLRVFVLCVLCMAAAVLICLFDVSLDYNRTERFQYEDDDYVYYVKAVPKIQLEESRRKIHEIERDDEDDKPNKGRDVED